MMVWCLAQESYEIFHAHAGVDFFTSCHARSYIYVLRSDLRVRVLVDRLLVHDYMKIFKSKRSDSGRLSKRGMRQYTEDISSIIEWISSIWCVLGGVLHSIDRWSIDCWQVSAEWWREVRGTDGYRGVSSETVEHLSIFRRNWCFRWILCSSIS